MSVVLIQADSKLSHCLVTSLRSSFHAVHEVQSLDELRNGIAKHRAAVVIVDMEMIPLADVERLSHDFPGVGIVCTHRLADEAMWTAALSAGAADICPAHDARSILTTALRSAAQARSAAA